MYLQLLRTENIVLTSDQRTAKKCSKNCICNHGIRKQKWNDEQDEYDNFGEPMCVEQRIDTTLPAMKIINPITIIYTAEMMDYTDDCEPMDCTIDSEFTEYMNCSEIMDYSESMDEHSIPMLIAYCERVVSDKQHDEIDDSDDATNDEPVECSVATDEHPSPLQEMISEPNATGECCCGCEVNEKQYDKIVEDEKITGGVDSTDEDNTTEYYSTDNDDIKSDDTDIDDSDMDKRTDNDNSKDTGNTSE